LICKYFTISRRHFLHKSTRIKNPFVGIKDLTDGLLEELLGADLGATLCFEDDNALDIKKPSQIISYLRGL